MPKTTFSPFTRKWPPKLEAKLQISQNSGLISQTGCWGPNTRIIPSWLRVPASSWIKYGRVPATGSSSSSGGRPPSSRDGTTPARNKRRGERRRPCPKWSISIGNTRNSIWRRSWRLRGDHPPPIITSTSFSVISFNYVATLFFV